MHRIALTSLADRHGLVVFEHWRNAGGSISGWRRAIAAGRLESVHPGVTRLPGAPATPVASIAAAVLAAGPAALASHRSSAVLWGVLRADTSPPHVIVPRRQRSPTTTSIVVHRPTDRLDLRPQRREGIAVCNPLRLAVDLGAVTHREEVEEAVEQLIVAALVTVGVLRAALERHARSGHDGIGALRSVLDDRALGRRPNDSVLEEVFARLLRDHALPTARFHPVVVLDGTTYVPDFVFPDQRVAVEVDGFATHSSRRSFEQDRARDVHFAAHGWLVVRFTWLQVMRRPGAVATRLRAILARR